MWSGRRLTKIQTTTRRDHVWPDLWTKIGKAVQDREKPKLDNAQKMKGIHVIDPDDEEYKKSQECHKKTGKTYGSRAV